MSSFHFTDPEVVAEVAPILLNNVSLFYFTDPEVVQVSPRLLLKSIMKKARNTKEVTSRKKVMFADIEDRRAFCIEDGSRMKSTKQMNLAIRQKLQLQNRMREYAARNIRRHEDVIKKELCVEDEESPQSDQAIKNELQELCGLDD